MGTIMSKTAGPVGRMAWLWWPAKRSAPIRRPAASSSHIILHEFVGPFAHVPVWFDEGVAMYQEKARRPGSHQVVKKAIENGQFIPLTQLTDMRLYNGTAQDTVDFFYTESASAVNFMITELGEEHFYKLCRELKDETPFEDALAKTYMRAKNLEELNKLWVKFLEEQ
jgi:Peptidase MA superfamily